MRHDRLHEPAVPLRGDRGRGRTDVLRGTDARPSEGRRVPGVRAGQRRDPDRVSRPVSVGGRVARDRAARERAPGSSARDRGRVGVGPAAVGDLPLLQERDRCAPGPPARAGTTGGRVAVAALVGGAAAPVPDRFRHEPGDAGRDHVELRSIRSTSRRSPTSRSAHDCCTCRASPTWRCGARRRRRSRSRPTRRSSITRRFRSTR